MTTLFFWKVSVWFSRSSQHWNCTFEGCEWHQNELRCWLLYCPSVVRPHCCIWYYTDTTLENWAGVTETTLDWFRSYLSNRTFSISWKGFFPVMQTLPVAFLKGRFLVLHFFLFIRYHWVMLFVVVSTSLSIFMQMILGFTCLWILQTLPQSTFLQPVLETLRVL